MTVANALLKARSVGVRNFRDKLSRFIKKHELFIVTEHGEPTSVLMPYEDMLEIVDVLDELQDKETLKTIAEGRKAINAGRKGILASTLFKKRVKK